MRSALVAPELPGPAAVPRPGLPCPAEGGLPLGRWALLAVLFLAEVLGLSVAFDAGVRANDPGWAGTLVYWSPRLLRAALLGAVAGAVLAAWYLRDELVSASRTRRPSGTIALWVLALLSAFALFAVTTGHLLGPGTKNSPVGAAAVA
ncbi:MAG: hypothetical protein J2P46_02855, partial [Zavarzinella sp.]|nr:hypothetical protein [Zavarzinella sp.]